MASELESMDMEDVGSVIDAKWAVVKPVIESVLIDDSISGKLIRYQINTGGRRIRPFFTLLFCAAHGGKEQDALYPAAASELIHNASLVVDDVIDEQDVRREVVTTPKKFGTSVAWCSSVDYCASALASLRKGRMPEEMVTLFIKTLKDMADGQTKDVYYNVLMENTGNPIGEEEYIDNIYDRTASLFEFSCAMGVLSSASTKGMGGALAFGRGYGIAFQIANDIRDAFGSEGLAGKDMVQGKVNNAVFLNALWNLSGKGRETLLSCIKSKGQNIAGAMALMQETGAHEAASAMLKKYARQAEESAPKGPEGRVIKASIDYFFGPYY